MRLTKSKQARTHARTLAIYGPSKLCSTALTSRLCALKANIPVSNKFDGKNVALHTDIHREQTQ